MAREPNSTQVPGSKAPAADADDVPRRLREAREGLGISLRQLARSLDISASALSQIETGRSRPSVRTLYALVSHLNLSLDELFDNEAGIDGSRGNARRTRRDSDTETNPVPVAGETRPGAKPVIGGGVSVPAPGNPVQHTGDRSWLDLDSGVRWERLTSQHDPLIDFLHVTYEPGGASTPNQNLARHAGHEYGIVLSGTIAVTIGFETYPLKPGDSISFDSNQPHRLMNPGSEVATAIWFVVGRRSDARQPVFDAAAFDES